MRVVWHNYKARFAMLLRRKCCFVPRHETTEFSHGLGQNATSQTIVGPLPAHRPFERMLLLRADVECEASLRCVGIDGERAPVHVISARTRSPDPDAHRVSADLWLALIHPSAVRPCHLNSAESAFQILRKRQRYFVRCCANCRANWGTRMVEKGVSVRNGRTE
jgi:hypothetical protein